MGFSFNTFSELLSEFQKYLSERIPKVVYYTLGLVILVLGALGVYILGWDPLVRAWQQVDVFFKVTLALGCALLFFIVAYVLGTLQGIIERWFQGDIRIQLLRWWGLRRHHRRWQNKNASFTQMYTIYYDVKTTLDEANAWASTQPTTLLAVRPLPQYHIITEADLLTQTIDKVPPGLLQQRDEALGAIVRHPLDEGARIAEDDVLRLPADLQQPTLIALTIFSDLVPAALRPGDRLLIYPASGATLTPPRQTAQLVQMKEFTRQGRLGSQEQLTHLTLAIAEQDLPYFTALPHDHTLRVVRQIILPPATASLPKSVTPPTRTTRTPLSVEKRKMYREQLLLLKEQHQQGLKWLERLRIGKIEKPEILDNLKRITQILEELEPQRSAGATQETDKRQAEHWWSQFADLRARWIELLDQARSELAYRVEQEHKSFSLYYPATQSAVTSTAVGNVFRAVDSYGKLLYGLDTALVLPRLQIVMAKETRDQLSKAHEQVALLEWLCLSSLAIGLLGAVIALFAHHYILAGLLLAQIYCIPRFILRPALLSSALDYAVALRLAYDRERGKVLAMIGIPLPSPLDQEREKAAWQSIQEWWEYGKPPGNYELQTHETQ